MKRIAIIGGGISGLSAAYYLEQQRRAGAEVEYSVLERAERMGGVLVSERVDGCLIEAGPDSFLTEKPWAAALCRELGLGDQIIGSNDAQRRTFILVKGRLVEMPDGLMFMVPTKLLPTVFTPLFSWPRSTPSSAGSAPQSWARCAAWRIRRWSSWACPTASASRLKAMRTCSSVSG
jgi:oxygen-dependent protoporphyrinogen oxidase